MFSMFRAGGAAGADGAGAGPGAGPVGDVFTFANNKGGSGKSTMLFQLACAYAQARPEESVLVIDLSLYSDVSTLLMGGTHREQILAACAGEEALVQVASSPDRRAEGLLASLERDAGADVLDYAVTPCETNPKVPANLKLVASCEKLPDVEGTYYRVASKLRQSLARLGEGWTVFIDTDHLAASGIGKLALCAASKILVPLSTDDLDFKRMFYDPTGHSLVEAIKGLREKSQLHGKLHCFLFNRVKPKKNEEFETEMWRSPFTPNKPTTALLENMAGNLYAYYEEDGFKLFAGEIRTHADFKPYFFCFRDGAESVMNASKQGGEPIVAMDHNARDLSRRFPGGLEIKLTKDAILAFKGDIMNCVNEVLL